MSNYAYSYQSLIAGSAEFDRMKQELRSILSLMTSRIGFERVDLPRNADKKIWCTTGDIAWKISIVEHKFFDVRFIYGGDLCLQFSPANGELRLPFGSVWLVTAHEHLQEYVDGMLKEFGALLGERLKLFSVLGERVMAKKI